MRQSVAYPTLYFGSETLFRFETMATRRRVRSKLEFKFLKSAKTTDDIAVRAGLDLQ